MYIMHTYRTGATLVYTLATFKQGAFCLRPFSAQYFANFCIFWQYIPHSRNMYGYRVHLIFYNNNNNNNKPVLKIRLKCDIGIKGSGNTDLPILKIAYDS